MENITYIGSGSWDSSLTNLDCNDLTNNGLYMIFIGYVVPLLSPTMRAYLKDIFATVKNVGRVSGQIVSLTEFGYTKVQGIKNNADMIDFIQRVCKNKDLNVLPKQIIDLAWESSGDTGKNGGEQSWNKFLSELDRLHTLNILDKTTSKP
uniref:Uncharacterized protein n=1 Tax=viral metagenome TaxID=1070528 RepID=A0A6C0KZ63_9ZZZZ|tara:strand:+ start:14533 stop:14982 length:450 start_codon:yes stop_codon:yes gene_type:complete